MFVSQNSLARPGGKAWSTLYTFSNSQANPGSPGKWTLKQREREREREYCDADELCCCTVCVRWVGQSSCYQGLQQRRRTSVGQRWRLRLHGSGLSRLPLAVSSLLVAQVRRRVSQQSLLVLHGGRDRRQPNQDRVGPVSETSQQRIGDRCQATHRLNALMVVPDAASAIDHLCFSVLTGSDWRDSHRSKLEVLEIFFSFQDLETCQKEPPSLKVLEFHFGSQVLLV